jgi:hypothetical protein
LTPLLIYTHQRHVSAEERNIYSHSVGCYRLA